MIKRTFDGEFLTRVANIEAVRPLLGGEGPIDLKPAVADPRNVVLQSGRGGFMFMPLYEGVYEVHSIFLPSMNGMRVAADMKQAREYMFVRTDCQELLTKVPETNKGAGWLADQAGFQEIDRRADAWPGGAAVSYRKLTLDTWVASCSTVAEQGRGFHGLLESAKKASGSELPTHPDDEAHDRAVGATVLMIKAGNTIKGVNHFNKWAIFHGYRQIELLSEQPVIVDAGDAILGLSDGQMEVLQCR